MKAAILALSGAAVAALLLLQSIAKAADTALVAAKRAELAGISQESASRNVHGSYVSPLIRKPTPRDAGQGEVVMFIKDSNFRFVGDIGFFVPELSVSLVPNDPASPVVFDDPASFSIRTHTGTAVVTAGNLDALMNHYVFNVSGASLKNLSFATGDGLLTIAGRMNRRGKWGPFAMKGGITLEDGHVLIFTPSAVEVAGIPALSLLESANVKLDELLTVDVVGAKLVGNKIYLDADVLFPPPALHLKIAAAQVEPQGLVLRFDDGIKPAAPPLPVERSSFMIIEGGDVKFLRAMPINVLGEFISADPTRKLDFCLYSYRDQQTAGWIKVPENGAVVGFLKNYPDLPEGIRQASEEFAPNRAAVVQQQQARWQQAKQGWESQAGGAPAGVQPVAEHRQPSLRASGVGEVALKMRNVNFHFTDGIGIVVPDLDASLIPANRGDPVIFDNPWEWSIDILKGHVIVPPDALTHLFNEHILDYSPRPLNGLTIDAADDYLVASGGVKLWSWFPGVWLPTRLGGNVVLNDDNNLVYYPDSIRVLRIPLAQVLHITHIKLTYLLNVNRKGAELVDSALVLDPRQVFPPPALNGRVSSVKMMPDGLHLAFGGASVEDSSPPPVESSSYMWLHSGDPELTDIIVNNSRVEVISEKEGAQLSNCQMLWIGLA